MTPQQLNDLVEIWKVLEILSVSLDRIGASQALGIIPMTDGALDRFFNPKLTRQIAEARSKMVKLLEENDPAIGSVLETLAENEDEMGYWRGNTKPSS